MPKQFQPVFQVRFGSGMELCIEPRVGGFKPHQNAPRSRFIEGGVTLYTSCADAQKDKRPASPPYPLHHVDEHLIRVPKVLSGLQNKRLEAEPVHGVLGKPYDLLGQEAISFKRLSRCPDAAIGAQISAIIGKLQNAVDAAGVLQPLLP